MASDEDLLRLHTPRYVELVRELSAGPGGDAGYNAIVGPGTFEIATLAAGGCLTAVDSVLDGLVDNAFALVRPPGHHALADHGLGYCIFGNTALAVMHARSRGVPRVAVIDWDVHHGNGTQVAFWDDPSVLTISLHQDRHFPHDSGLVDELGSGDGYGANINIPLPPASGIGAYRAAFERVVIPALSLFHPELIVVACGFDASALDPLGRQLLYSEGFRELTRLTREAAEGLCEGRLVVCQEGGYSTGYLPFCGLAVLEELSGTRTGVEDPYMAARRGAFAYQELQPHQDAAVRAAERTLSLLGG
jgi:acetoin utilization deacetylase AcuC-like enzyme